MNTQTQTSPTDLAKRLHDAVDELAGAKETVDAPGKVDTDDAIERIERARSEVSKVISDLMGPGEPGAPAATPRPHEAVVMTEADGMAFPRQTTIEEHDRRAFAYEVGHEIERQIYTVACDAPVETKIVLHIVKDD